MSSYNVRQAFRAELRSFLGGLAAAVPFYDSVNDWHGITDPLWVTCSFFTFNREAMTCLGVEQGTCEVSVYADGGASDQAAVMLADKIEQHFIGNPVLTNKVSVVNTSPPNEATSGDGVRWYGVTVPLDYMVKP